MSFGTFVTTQWMTILGVIAGLATAAIAIFWSKYLVRFLLIIATIALVIFVVTFKIPELDERLPGTFLGSLPIWFLGLGLVALYSTAHLVATLVRVYSGPVAETGAEGTFGDIQTAWREILIQLSQARINPAGQDLYLLVGPEEALAVSLVDAARLQIFARAPSSLEAPIHCYAVEKALFLSCAGASSMGSRGSDGSASLEYLCQLIEALNPDRPTLRGIAVLIPYEWTEGSESLQQVAAIREDLQVIRRTLKVRCPTLTICCLRESIPGFNDFAARLPVKLRHNRCGFSVPLSQSTEGAVIRRGMIWMTRWFQVWSLNLMVEKIHDKDGNGRILSMNRALRTSRDSLVQLLEAGLTVHQHTEPILYRGFYFASCGSSPENHGFTTGLLSGKETGRLLADRKLTSWSREADRLDRDYRRGAWALGLASALIAVPIWYVGIIARLADQGQGLVGWAGLIALILTWGIVLRPRPRPNRRARQGSMSRTV